MKWKQIFAGYEINDQGAIRNKRGRILKQDTRRGYAYIGLKGKKYYIHRLMLQYWHKLDITGKECHHLNHNTLDNRAENLMCVTHAENSRMRRSYKRLASWQKKAIIDLYVEYRKTLSPRQAICKLDKMCDVSLSTIRRIIKRS